MKKPLVSTDVVSRIYKNYEQQFNGEFRPHLGASQGGDPCSRKLFYNFRHAIKTNHDGRLLKLFQRGHKEEFTFEEELKKAGFNIITTDDSGKQFRLGTDKNKHVSGSGDGFAEVNTDAFEHFTKGEWVVVEMKTHNDKSFKKLVKEGVSLSKPTHIAQMNLYMRWSKLTKALYIAVNKNTDELYVECVYLDDEFAQFIEDKMIHIVESHTIPVQLHTDPTNWECRFCDYHSICHTDKFDLNISCRTCAYSVAKPDGTWYCHNNKETINQKTERVGCDNHVIHPDFLASVATATGVDDESIVFDFFNGTTIKNGNGEDALDSELIASLAHVGFTNIDQKELTKIIKEL